MRPLFHFMVRENAARLGRAGRAFFVRRRAVATTGESPEINPENLARRLGEEKEFLLTVIRDVEAEFLETGKGVEQLTRQLGEIQVPCRELIRLTLGQNQDAVVSFTFQLLKKAEDLVLACYEQYDHVFANFDDLQQRLARLSKRHDDLMRVLLPLNFITTSFRIEASRNPPEVQETFSALADNMSRTVNEVRDTMERQFSDLAASEAVAQNLMAQTFASIRVHREEVAAILKTSRRQLNELSEALAVSTAGAADLSRLNESVNRHINSIVMAQQCQDITRQKIEHVGEAMETMRIHLNETRGDTARGQTEARQFVFHAGQIQLHQVRNVFDQLGQAADGLTSGIESLRAEAGAAADVAVRMGGATLDAKVADQCQAGIGEILAILNQAVMKIRDILAIFAPLQASFVDCTGKAAALANDVRYAGLNAQIFAVHAPDGGSLEVLAGHVRAISDDVIEQVGQMGHELSNTIEMVSNLRQRLEDFDILGVAEAAVLSSETLLSRTKLTELKEVIPLLIGRVAESQRAFAGAVEEILANVRFPAIVAGAGVRSVRFFEHLVEWGGEAGRTGSGVEVGAARKIDQLHSRYTMESERNAHAAAMQLAEKKETARPEPEHAAVSEKDTSAGQLGDNVELF